MTANAVKEQRIIVRSDEAFEVRNVLCQDSRIEFEVGSGKKKIHFIKMRFRGDGSSDAMPKSAGDYRSHGKRNHPASSLAAYANTEIAMSEQMIREALATTFHDYRLTRGERRGVPTIGRKCGRSK